MFFEFICLFSVLMDTIFSQPSVYYFSNSNKPSRMPSFALNGHTLPLQHLFHNRMQQKSAKDSSLPRSLLNSDVHSIGISSFTSSSPVFTDIFQNEQLLQQLSNEEIMDENTPRLRERRGIVLIDEDFNVPPKPGVKQSWGDGEFEKKNIEIMSTEEGSGQTEDFPIDTTPEQLQISTNKIKVTPTKEYGRIVSTVEHSDNMTSTSEHTDKVTSTSEHTDKVTSTSEHADKMVSTSEYADKDTSVDYIATTEDIEGSGDISVQITQTLPTTDKPQELHETCLKSTCNSDDLLLSPGITRKVPVGTNLTLSCSSLNISEHGFLKLYKYNDSENLLLEESNKENLNFEIPLSQRHHSGMYMCLKLTEKSCCHQQLDITVYEVPSYKTHLIIVGLIAAVSLFICILLGMYRSFKTKNYQVQMELQNMEKPVLF